MRSSARRTIAWNCVGIAGTIGIDAIAGGGGLLGVVILRRQRPTEAVGCLQKADGIALLEPLQPLRQTRPERRRVEGAAHGFDDKGIGDRQGAGRTLRNDRLRAQAIHQGVELGARLRGAFGGEGAVVRPGLGASRQE